MLNLIVNIEQKITPYSEEFCWLNKQGCRKVFHTSPHRILLFGDSLLVGETYCCELFNKNLDVIYQNDENNLENIYIYRCDECKMNAATKKFRGEQDVSTN